MTVLDLFVSAGVPETKAHEIYNVQNKTPIEDADASKKALLTCPLCKTGVKIKPIEFVSAGCPKCNRMIS